jgi:hypothetical protein
MTTDLLGDIQVHGGRRLTARVVATLSTAAQADPDAEAFETAPVKTLDLALDGVAGDRHAGFTRASGGREPWYPRGTVIRSGRQLSVVSVEELAEIATAMRIAELQPGWIGANLVLEGLPRLSYLPAGTRIALSDTAVIVIEDQNAPCRFAGRAIARRIGQPAAELEFPKLAKRLRGLVASVERPGQIRSGGEASVRIPEQWIY